MQKSARFPLLFRIWVIASGAVFTVAIGLQLFFSRTDYGFLYNEALLYTCLISCVSLLISLTVWLRRYVLKLRALKALVSVACVFFSFVGTWVFFGTIVNSAHIDTPAQAPPVSLGTLISCIPHPEGQIGLSLYMQSFWYMPTPCRAAGFIKRWTTAMFGRVGAGTRWSTAMLCII